MKILLIYPPDTHSIRTNVPGFVDEETGIYPPLGLLYIAASIRSWTDWEVDLLDCSAEKIGYKNLKTEIEKRKPDVVGIQALTFTLIDTLMTAKITKEIDCDIRVVLGGAHVNIYPKETLSMPYIDNIILGEGEHIICEFLKAVSGGNNFFGIKGLGYKNGANIFINESRQAVQKLDDLPFADRKMLKTERYYSLISQESPITTMISSRGCPFLCIYCDRPQWGKNFRARSAKNVVSEMAECSRFGIKEILFYDDTFTLDKKRVLEICSLIIERGIKINWDIRTRVDTVDEALLNRMAAAGCKRVHFGVEAATAQIQKVLKKDLDLENVKKMFTAAKKAGLKTLGYFMIGCPGETSDQIQKTIDFMLKLNTDYAHISVATPYPNTEMYRMGLAQGIFKNDYWKKFAEDPDPGFAPRLWTENLSEEELLLVLRKAYKLFYLRPAYVFKDLLEIKSVSELKNKISAGIKILFS